MKNLTSEQVEIIKDQIGESVSYGSMYPNVARTLVEILEAAINYTHSCTELKTFDIHECINEVTKSANKLSPWIVDARKDRSFRYRVKKAIDKMLYSN